MFLTIFTPIYNRAKFVPRLFETIRQQTCKDFEWIIIDDGSTDNTYLKIKEEVNKIDDPINIRFLKVKNGGKHRAINKAVKVAKGKYFFILDSDDLLLKDSVAIINKWCHEIDGLPDASNYAGVAGLRETPDKKIIGQSGTGNNYIDATNLERKKYKLTGDKAEVYKTNVLKKYPFKEFEGENFLGEGTVWDKIAHDGYLIRWYAQPIYIGEYFSDGLTYNALKNDIHNFKGLTYSTKQSIKYYKFKQRIGIIGYYSYIGSLKNIPIKKMAELINVSPIKIIIFKEIFILYKKVLHL